MEAGLAGEAITKLKSFISLEPMEEYTKSRATEIYFHLASKFIGIDFILRRPEKYENVWHLLE